MVCYVPYLNTYKLTNVVFYMKEMLIFDENTNRTSKHFDKLTKEKRTILDAFQKYCLIHAGENRTRKAKSNAIRFVVMADKNINEINLQDLRDFLFELKKSNFSQYYTNDVKGFVKRFLKWNFKDWSDRFDDFNDIKFISEPQRLTMISSDDMFSKESVEKMIKQESKLFWKTFLIMQYEAALRTGETRKSEWSKLDDSEDDVYWINILSKKNKNAIEKERIAAPLFQSMYFLDELKKQQKEQGIESKYIFPSQKNPGKEISASSVGKWFSRLTKKVFGESKVNYLLRHSQGEEMHKKVRNGSLSKDNATSMMGHSEKMFDKTYAHTNKQEMKKILKKQMLDIDFIAPEKKHKLEQQITNLKEQVETMQEQISVLSDKDFSDFLKSYRDLARRPPIKK